MIIDVLVIGGGVGGCLAALSAARTGRKTILVEASTYLGREFTTTLRPWLKSEYINDLNPEFRDILFWENQETGYKMKMQYNERFDCIIPIHRGAFLKNMAKILHDHGVSILFMSEVAGVMQTASGKVRGVVFGNKGGLQILWAKSVVDFTPDLRVLKHTGAKRNIKQKNVIARRTLEYFFTDTNTGIDKQAVIDLPGAAGSADLRKESRTLVVPARLGIFDNQIILHHGKMLDKAHLYVEYGIQKDVNNNTWEEQLTWEKESRRIAQKLAIYLKNEVSEFHNAMLAQSSLELFIPEITSSCEKHEDIFYLDEGRTLSEDISCEQINNLLKNASFIGKEAAYCALSRKIDQTAAVWMECGSLVPTDQYNLSPKTNNLFNINYDEIIIQDYLRVPVTKCDVLVAGGGTSGAPAAIAAGERGANVILVEPFWGLGGTSTIGGIYGYWYGYRGGYTNILDKQVNNLTKQISTQMENDRRWNAEAKMMVYFEEAEKAGVDIWFGCKVVDVSIESGYISDVLLLTRDGLRRVQPKITIDTTGDGDLAYMANVANHYGSKRGGMVQTFNHCNLVLGSQISGENIDLGFVDNSCPFDLSRCIMLGYQNCGLYGFSPYLGTRESRHIKGDYCLTVPDVILQKTYEDTIAIGDSDYDQHGIQGSAFARMGYLPNHINHWPVSIPYRCCLPEGIEGLLVGGKAFSASKDAFTVMRMIADIQNLGYSLGICAAQSVQDNVSPRKLDIAKIQPELIKIGIIPLKKPSKEIDILSVTKRLCDGDWNALFDVLCCKQEDILQTLQNIWETSNNKLYLAMALAWFGDDRGVSVIISNLKRLHELEFNGEFCFDDRHHDLNRYRYPNERPACGIQDEPEEYWIINQMITVLGLSGNMDAIDLLIDITTSTVPENPNKKRVRMDCRRTYNYDRILCLCFALERLACKRAAPALEALLSREYTKGYMESINYSANFQMVNAYLEVVIARTLARCGGIKGALILADYLQDVQAMLSNHAYDELREITGKDFGKDYQAYRSWLLSIEDLDIKTHEIELY